MTHISAPQLQLLWHTLGLSPSDPHKRTVSRNHFLTGPGDEDARQLDVLVSAGLMIVGKAPAFCPQDEVIYRATREGERLAIEKLPPLSSTEVA